MTEPEIILTKVNILLSYRNSKQKLAEFLFPYQPTVCLPPNSESYHAVAVHHYEDWSSILYCEYGQVVHHLQAALHPFGLLVALRVLVSRWNFILD